MNKESNAMEQYVIPSVTVLQITPLRPIATSDPMEQLQREEEWGWN